MKKIVYLLFLAAGFWACSDSSTNYSITVALDEAYNGQAFLYTRESGEWTLAVIDRGLGEMMRRDLVATAEVADLLLDLRSLLTFVPADPTVEPAGVN